MTEDFRREIERVSTALQPLAASLAGRYFLLSGAQGLLGNYFCEVIRQANRTYLAFKPATVVATDIVPATREDADGIRYVQADVTNLPSNVARFINYDYVVHLSGLASPVIYKREPLLTIDVAVTGSRQMLEVARNSGARYLFTSSSEVLQTPPPEWVPTPESYVGAIPTMTDRAPYDVSKALGETLAYVYATKYGVHTIVTRLFNAFGIGLKETDQRILPRIASALRAGRALTVYGRSIELPTRTYCPAANTTYGIFLALLRGEPANVYHIGAKSPEITVPELCKIVSRVVQRPVPFDIVAPPEVYQHEPLRRCPDTSKIERLGYSSLVDLEDGLRGFFAWALRTYTA